jgi:hypothetical protein
MESEKFVEAHGGNRTDVSIFGLVNCIVALPAQRFLH